MLTEGAQRWENGEDLRSCDPRHTLVFSYPRHTLVFS